MKCEVCKKEMTNIGAWPSKGKIVTTYVCENCPKVDGGFKTVRSDELASNGKP